MKTASPWPSLLSRCAVARSGRTTNARQLNVPDQYRGTAPDLPTSARREPLRRHEVAAVFQDEALQDLIKQALTNNYDMRIAASRILQAQANLGITRQPVPHPSMVHRSRERTGTQFFRTALLLAPAAIQISYIVDFWGQFRRATEALGPPCWRPNTDRTWSYHTGLPVVATYYFHVALSTISHLNTRQKRCEPTARSSSINN